MGAKTRDTDKNYVEGLHVFSQGHRKLQVGLEAVLFSKLATVSLLCLSGILLRRILIEREDNFLFVGSFFQLKTCHLC